MTFYMYKGKKFDIHAPHIIDDVQYPPGWFADPAEREKLGIEEGVNVQAPEIDPMTQRLVELPPVKVDGVWTQQWEVVSLDEATIAAKAVKKRMVQAAESKAALQKIDIACIRAMREFLLAKFGDDPAWPRNPDGSPVLETLNNNAARERSKLQGEQ